MESNFLSGLVREQRAVSMKRNHNQLQHEQIRGLLAEDSHDSFQDPNNGTFVVFYNTFEF